MDAHWCTECFEAGGGIPLDRPYKVKKISARVAPQPLYQLTQLTPYFRFPGQLAHFTYRRWKAQEKVGYRPFDNNREKVSS